MSRWRRMGGWLIKTLSVLYLVQCVTVLYWEFCPRHSAEKDSVRYEVYVGFGLPWGLLPVVGMMPVANEEPVILVKTDLTTGEKVSRGFDVFEDIAKKYPAVWPNHRR